MPAPCCRPAKLLVGQQCLTPGAVYAWGIPAVLQIERQRNLHLYAKLANRGIRNFATPLSKKANVLTPA